MAPETSESDPARDRKFRRLRSGHIGRIYAIRVAPKGIRVSRAAAVLTPKRAMQREANGESVPNVQRWQNGPVQVSHPSSRCQDDDAALPSAVVWLRAFCANEFFLGSKRLLPSWFQMALASIGPRLTLARVCLVVCPNEAANERWPSCTVRSPPPARWWARRAAQCAQTSPRSQLVQR